MLVPIDFTYTTSCMLSIITFAIRFAISHLLLDSLELSVYLQPFMRCYGHDLDLSWPLDVIGHIGHLIRHGGLSMPSLYL